MRLINEHKKYCYRITHIRNLPLILQNGIITKHHEAANDNYIEIGDREIIDYRNTSAVRLDGYGNIGEYIPFYFTPKTPMLYNIITGIKAPKVPKRAKHEILIIRCLINRLCTSSRWFFTDAQGNSSMSSHYNDLNSLAKIDWDIIQISDFKKTDDDFDKTRRYLAEFLVYQQVLVDCFESLHVYNQQAHDYIVEQLQKKNVNLDVCITPNYFFG